MFKLLTRIPVRRFCLAPEIEKVYELKYHVKDLTVLRGLNQEIPYFKINDKIFRLPKDKLIFSLDENSHPSDENVEFFDNNLNHYHSTVPLPIVCQ